MAGLILYPKKIIYNLFLSIVIFVFLIYLYISSNEDLYLLPAICLVGTGWLFIFAIKKRNEDKISFIELGSVYAAIIVIYGLYPAISFLIYGFSFSPYRDIRLYLAQPTPSEIGIILWHYAIYLISFALAYLYFRGRNSNSQKILLVKTNREIIVAVFLFYFIAKLFFVFLKVYYHIPEIESYGERYLVYSHLPLILRQLTNYLQGTIFTLQLVMLAFLSINYSKYKLIIFSWIAFEVILAFNKLGARTETFLLILSFVIIYNYIVKPFKLSTAIMCATISLAVFALIGVIRGGNDMNEHNLLFYLFNNSNEFEVLFANAYDLYQLKASGAVGDISPVFYLADFFRLFPQQILPFVKIDLSSWYVNTFYRPYAQVGGGLAFGVISESIIGLGWIDLVWRGCILGFLYACLHRYFTRNMSFLNFIVYVWLIVQSYQSFRNTTFSLLPMFFYNFFIPIVFIIIISQIIRGSIIPNYKKGDSK